MVEPSPTATVTRLRMASPAVSGGIGYMTLIGRSMPASRSSSASSRVATQRPSAPASASARAIGIAP